MHVPVHTEARGTVFLLRFLIDCSEAGSMEVLNWKCGLQLPASVFSSTNAGLTAHAGMPSFSFDVTLGLEACTAIVLNHGAIPLVFKHHFYVHKEEKYIHIFQDNKVSCWAHFAAW